MVDFIAGLQAMGAQRNKKWAPFPILVIHLLQFENGTQIYINNTNLGQKSIASQGFYVEYFSDYIYMFSMIGAPFLRRAWGMFLHYMNSRSSVASCFLNSSKAFDLVGNDKCLLREACPPQICMIGNQN